jgi:hypothetical protein
VAEQKRDLSPVRNFPDAHRGLEVPEDVVVRCKDCHARHHRTLVLTDRGLSIERPPVDR